MKSLFSKNLDIVDYVVNSELEKIASIVNQCSDKTKTAYIPSYDEQLERNENDFAIVLHNSKNETLRKYAMYTPELTEVNIAFLVDNMHTLPEEVIKVAATNLTCAAKKFSLDIPEELSKYASTKFVDRTFHISEINEQEFLKKTANKSEPINLKYALHGKYPINTEYEIEKAASWFNRNYNRLTIDEVDEFVTNIKSTEKPLVGILEKYANLNKNEFNPDFYNHINVRKAQLRDDDEEGAELYNDLLRKADEIGVEKCAYVLEVIDKELGLDEFYGTVVTNPFESTYGQVKTAGVDIDGTFVTSEMLRKADPSDLSVLVGNDVTTELRGEDGLVVLESLPTPVKLELARIL